MKIKVYNENGIVRVSKITPNGLEQTMFSDVQHGQVAVIDVEAEISYRSHKEDIRSKLTISLEERTNNDLAH